MSWRDTLLQASFRGVSFDVESVGDTTARSLALHEYPYRDGADAEDLGTGARRMRFTAIVWGDDYETRLQALLAAVRQADVGELVHPVFGTVPNALCALWRIDHAADLRDGARLELEFVEAGAAVRVFDQASPVLAAEKISTLGDEARAAADEALVERVETVAAGPVPTALKLKSTMQQALTKLRALTDTTPLRALLSDLDPLFYPQAYVADARAVLDRALQGLPFGGRNLLFDGPASGGSGMTDFDRAAHHLGPAAMTLPAVDANGALVQAHARVHAACSLAEAGAIVLAAELDEPMLERADVEQLANTAREAIQAAIEGMRGSAVGGPSAAAGAALRALAYQVQVAATSVIEQRPPVVVQRMPVTGPLRLVAHVLYGDHSRAGELVRLNAFGRTLGVQAGEELRVYAR